jgi:hypothetical protein
MQVKTLRLAQASGQITGMGVLARKIVDTNGTVQVLVCKVKNPLIYVLIYVVRDIQRLYMPALEGHSKFRCTSCVH